MILALVAPQDLQMWRAAASLLSAPWMVQVEDASYSGPALNECNVLLTHAPGTLSAFLVAKNLESVQVAVSFGDSASSIEMSKRLFLESEVNDHSFDSERFGGHTICHMNMRIGVKSSLGMRVDPPSPTTGPGSQAHTGGIVLWPISDYENIGVRVSRDDKSVIESVYLATTGNGPLWVSPGFPFMVPAVPGTFRTLDGKPVHGILCTSICRAGGWVVLRREDVLKLIGHPGDISWEEIRHIIGVQPAASILGWLCAISSRFPSRLANS